MRVRELLFALAVAFILRLCMLWLVDIKLVNDAATYDVMARNLLERGTFSGDLVPPIAPSAYRPPLYPAFMSLVYGVGGYNLLLVQLAQIALSLLTIWLAFVSVRKLAPGVERCALWLMALSPFDAVYSIAFLSEGMATFMLTSAVTLWSLTQARWRWGLLGAMLGLATLCRDIYIALAPFFAAMWLLWGEGSGTARLRAGILVLAASLLVLAPWSARNAVVLEKWAPVSSGRLGFSLWTGAWTVNFANVQVQGGKRIYPAEAYLDDAERQRHEALMATGNLQALDRFYLESFVRRIREEPLNVFGRWIARAPLLWLGTRFDIFDLNPRVLPYASPQWYTVKALLFLANGLLVAAGIWGIVSCWVRRSPLRWLSVPILFTFVVYFPLNSFENRYSQPVYTLLLLFAAVSMRDIYLWLRSRTQLHVDSSPESELPRSNAY